jgi:hypothetical protein
MYLENCDRHANQIGRGRVLLVAVRACQGGAESDDHKAKRDRRERVGEPVPRCA